MGETVLVRADLPLELIEAGRTLLRELDAQAVGIDAAFWLLDESSGFWHLVLGKRSVRESGSTALYHKVNQILTELGMQDRLWIGMVSIVDQRSAMIQALRKALGAARSVDGVRLDNAKLGDVRMLGCLLYRVSAKQKLAPQPSDAGADRGKARRAEA
jgi:hypothetical protein